MRPDPTYGPHVRPGAALQWLTLGNSAGARR